MFEPEVAQLVQLTFKVEYGKVIASQKKQWLQLPGMNQSEQY